MKSTFTRAPLLAALDIGSTKMTCALAQLNERTGALQLYGLGNQVSQGVKNGQIVNLEAASHTIAKTIHAAEAMARQPIHDVFVNISGKVMSLRPTLSEALHGREVVEDDILKLLQRAQELSLKNENLEVVHCLPLMYTVDDGTVVQDPLGMYAETLGVKVHVISAIKTRLRNALQALHKAQIDAHHIVYSPYAAGLGTLMEDEMDLGAAVIDFGGGTTSVSVFKGGQCIYANSLPIGGIHITHDIAHALSTPIAQAERLKILHGSALLMASAKKERLKIPQLSVLDQDLDQTITRYNLNAVIHPRIEEIFDLLLEQLKAQPDIFSAARRFILTGGGSNLSDLKEYLTKRVAQQVRLGSPVGLEGLTETSNGPGFAVCAGLLHYAARALQAGDVAPPPSWLTQITTSLGSLWKR